LGRTQNKWLFIKEAVIPIYEFKCPNCGRSDEHILSYSELKNVEVMCTPCSMAMTRLISMPAKTPNAWHGNWSDGMGHTMYSMALGRKVANKREEQKIMEARGFVNEKDLGEGWYEKTQSTLQWRKDERTKKSEIYKKTLEETGSAEKAVEVAFPASEALDGTLDKIYDDKIET